MTYDVIILGTGGIGSAALYHASRRGLRVLGIDRFPPAHDHGSSHGETRIIRMSYFEHSDYVPLLRRAYTLWDNLCEETGRTLFHRSGVVYFGPETSPVITGVTESARIHDLDISIHRPRSFDGSFANFAPAEDNMAVFEPDAGFLMVEDCVSTHIEEAKRNGATCVYGEAVMDWSASNRSVEVRTNKNTYRAQSLIVTAGAWASSLLQDLDVDLKILRKHLHWFETDDGRYGLDNGCPGFFFDVGGRFFYGFPAIDGQGVKVADHSGGTPIEDPLTDDRAPEAEDNERIEHFVSRHLPGVSSRRSKHAVCFYTMSPDEHFIVDRHPAAPNVAFAAGLSGHGFKFASALGKTLVDLATGRPTDCDIGFLSLDRPGLRD